MKTNNFVHLLKEREKFGKQHHMFNIPEETGRFLYVIMQVKKPSVILEVGTSNGYSTLWFAYASPKAKIYTIEQDPQKIVLAKGNFKTMKNIHLFEGPANKILKKIKIKPDVVFLDATKNEYKSYLKVIEPHLKKDSLIIADNTISHAKKMRDYLIYVNKKYTSTTLKIGTGVTLSICSRQI